jgi:SEC-C motif-containing protein
MAKLSSNTPCPCGSGARAKGCCGPILDGAPAPTAEALMRSRYTAYGVSATGHLMRTTAPESPHQRSDRREWQAELAAYCAAIHLHELTVIAVREEGDRGWVRFFARLRIGEQDRSFGENSAFVRRDGRWLYVDAIP